MPRYCCAAFPRSGGAASGAQTTLLILRRPQRLDRDSSTTALPADAPHRRGIAGLPDQPHPGTTTVEIDEQRHTLRLHMLDTRDVEAALTEIHRTIQRPPFRVLFGEKPLTNLSMLGAIALLFAVDSS